VTGGVEDTFSVTFTVVFGFMAVGAEIVRWPTYVPATSPLWLADTETLPGVTPDGVAVSHAESLAVV